ncbi:MULTISPECIES: hypothetical protein [unclassified Bradyrhizobium]|uniref:hypothetical protein n=1 Tax=unclassified Bradyrhizobium TaxID=2631580 RepID=UPI00339165C3
MPRRPKDRLAPEIAAGLPLFGRDPLRDDDVTAMIRAEFHDDPRFVNDPEARRRFARRGALMVAMPALAGIASVVLARMTKDDYDADAAIIRVEVQRRPLALPVTPALKAVLDDWIEVCPTDKGDALLPSEFGAPAPQSVKQFLEQLGWRLGAQRNLQKLLLEYHRANLAKAGQGAYRKYWRIRPTREQPVPETGEILRPLVEVADPFGGRIGFLTRPHRAATILRGADTTLPPVAHATGRTKAGRRLADDHPLTKALSDVWRRGRNERGDRLDDLFAKFGSDIEEALADGVSIKWMVALTGCCDVSFKMRLDARRAGAAPPTVRRHRPRPTPSTRRVPPTEDERRRLDDIAATAWPSSRRHFEPFRRRMLADHFPFVRRLLRERKITRKAAHKLFRLSPTQLTLRVFDLDNGLFHLALAPPPSPAERYAAQALALREFVAAPTRSWAPLWRRLRLDYHYPLDFPAFASLIQRHLDGRRGKRRTFGGLPMPPPAAV